MCLLFRILLLVSYLSTLCLSKIFSIFSKVCCLFVYLSNLYTQGEAQTYNPEIIITTFTDWARQTPQCWFKSVLFLYLDLWSTLCLSLQLRPRSFFFFCIKCPVVSTLFVEKSILCLVNGRPTFVKKSITLIGLVLFGALYSVPLIYHHHHTGSNATTSKSVLK